LAEITSIDKIKVSPNGLKVSFFTKTYQPEVATQRLQRSHREYSLRFILNPLGAWIKSAKGARYKSLGKSQWFGRLKETLRFMPD
jgi:hypothetical protein